MNENVLIAAPVHDVLVDGLQSAGYSCVIKERITQEEAMQLVGSCVGIVTSTRLQIDKELIDAATSLQWIGRMGSGMEVIDLPYAQSKNIGCYSSPEGNCNAVAEHALGMLLCLNKNILRSNKEILEGKWLREENRGVELSGKTVGIIGFGHTGRAFARVLSGLGVQVLAYDKQADDFEPEFRQVCTSIERIFAESDIISFHVPLGEDTTHYMNTEFVSRMNNNFILINTSRGVVIETAALYKGLTSGKIKGACLDVWEQEPISAMDKDSKTFFEKISAMENVIITSHIAGYSHEALYKMSEILLKKIVSKK